MPNIWTGCGCWPFSGFPRDRRRDFVPVDRKRRAAAIGKSNPKPPDAGCAQTPLLKPLQRLSLQKLPGGTRGRVPILIWLVRTNRGGGSVFAGRQAPPGNRRICRTPWCGSSVARRKRRECRPERNAERRTGRSAECRSGRSGAPHRRNPPAPAPVPGPPASTRRSGTRDEKVGMPKNSMPILPSPARPGRQHRARSVPRVPPGASTGEMVGAVGFEPTTR